MPAWVCLIYASKWHILCPCRACTPQTAYPRPTPSIAARPGPLPTGLFMPAQGFRPTGPTKFYLQIHVLSIQPGAAHLYLLVRCPYQYRTQPYLPSLFTQPLAAHRLAGLPLLGNKGYMGNLVSVSVPMPCIEHVTEIPIAGTTAVKCDIDMVVQHGYVQDM